MEVAPWWLWRGWWPSKSVGGGDMVVHRGGDNGHDKVMVGVTVMEG